MKKVRVGISVGDINGIGMEVILKTFQDKRMLELCTPIIFGSAKLSSFYKKQLGIEELNFNQVDDLKKVNAKKLNTWIV
jgi:4-hydroxy-L-threonine phosphate dehydrogenase PdxA